MKCKICGNNVAVGQSVCDFCGSPIKAEQQAEQFGNSSFDNGNQINLFEDEGLNYGEKQAESTYEERNSSDDDANLFSDWQTPSESHTSNKTNNSGNSNKNTIIYVMIGIIVVLLCVIVAIIIRPNNNDTDIVNSEHSTVVSEVEKDIETEVVAEPEEEKKDDLIDIRRIDSIIATDADNADISVCVVDIKNDAIYATDNAEYAMSASALVNVPILYTVAKELESGEASWNSQVKFQYRFAGRGTIRNEQDGSFFDLDYLVRQMLNYSDNNATNSLVDYFDRGYINDICRRNSFDSVDIQRYLGESSEHKDNYISAKDAAEMLAEIYTSSDADINKNYLLSNFSIYDDVRYNGVGKNLRNAATFLNHNAVTSSIYNEIAIVISDEAEYIISVLCNNGKMATSADTVSDISDYVFEALNQ